MGIIQREGGVIFIRCVRLDSNLGIIQGRLSDIYYMCEVRESLNVLRYWRILGIWVVPNPKGVE